MGALSKAPKWTGMSSPTSMGRGYGGGKMKGGKLRAGKGVMKMKTGGSPIGEFKIGRKTQSSKFRSIFG